MLHTWVSGPGLGCPRTRARLVDALPRSWTRALRVPHDPLSGETWTVWQDPVVPGRIRGPALESWPRRWPRGLNSLSFGLALAWKTGSVCTPTAQDLKWTEQPRQRRPAGTGSCCCEHPLGAKSPFCLLWGPKPGSFRGSCPVNEVQAEAASSGPRPPIRKCTLTWSSEPGGILGPLSSRLYLLKVAKHTTPPPKTLSSAHPSTFK